MHTQLSGGVCPVCLSHIHNFVLNQIWNIVKTELKQIVPV